MLESRTDADRMENDVYQALDVGILVRKKTDENNITRRYIDQICFYIREKGENRIEMVVFDGKCVLKELPEPIMRIFRRETILNPFYCPALEQILASSDEQNIDTPVFVRSGAARQGGSV